MSEHVLARLEELKISLPNSDLSRGMMVGGFEPFLRLTGSHDLIEEENETDYVHLWWRGGYSSEYRERDPLI